jgi:uncharacterized protein YkwD
MASASLRFGALFILLAAFGTLSGCGRVSAPEAEVISNPATAPVPVDPAEAARRISALRAEDGLGPIVVSAELTAVAQAYADRLAAAGEVRHDLDGSLRSRLADGGYVWMAAGENIGGGYHSLDEALDRWTASPEHLENLLQPLFTEIGIATGFNIDSPYRTFWVLILAVPA